MKLQHGIMIVACLAASVGIADDAETGRSESTPAVAVDGYCIVSTLYPGVWVKGEHDIFTDYRGRRYLFLSEEEKVRFDASPKTFTPVFEGLDAVALLDEEIKIAGRREWGCFHQERVFFFESEKNMRIFMSSPDCYVARVNSREEIDSRIEKHEAKRGKSIPEFRAED